MSELSRTARVTRIRGTSREEADDGTAVEEPLEVRLDGNPFAVVMRTPGDDHSLAAGFLLSEGVVTHADQILAIEYCMDPAEPRLRNVIDVALDGVDVSARLGERRRVAMSAACGLCGRSTIESLRVEGRAVDASWRIDAAVVSALPDRLLRRQEGFTHTGGLHAAGLFDAGGRLDGFAEDIGRHNAVDKVIGHRLLRERFPVADRMLFVSGRASFEIVQKAWLAGIPCVGAVSAPSSLAVDLAQEAGITLVGFVRDDRFNIYAHAERIP
jgi:FdhD protein